MPKLDIIDKHPVNERYDILVMGANNNNDRMVLVQDHHAYQYRLNGSIWPMELGVQVTEEDLDLDLEMVPEAIAATTSSLLAGAWDW